MQTPTTPLTKYMLRHLAIQQPEALTEEEVLAADPSTLYSYELNRHEYFEDYDFSDRPVSYALDRRHNVFLKETAEARNLREAIAVIEFVYNPENARVLYNFRANEYIDECLQLCKAAVI